MSRQAQVPIEDAQHTLYIYAYKCAHCICVYVCMCTYLYKHIINPCAMMKEDRPSCMSSHVVVKTWMLARAMHVPSRFCLKERDHSFRGLDDFVQACVLDLFVRLCLTCAQAN